MIILTLPPNEEDRPEGRRWLDEKHWRTPLVVLFFSLVLLLVLGILGLVAWFSLQPRLAATGTAQVAGPVGSARITVDPPGGAVGTLLHVSGQGWNPNDVVFVSLEAPDDPSQQDFAYAGAVAGEDGKFVVSFALPEAERWAGAGAIKVVAWAEQSGAKAVTIFQVAAIPVTATPVHGVAGAAPEATATHAITQTAAMSSTQTMPVALVPSSAAPLAVNWYGEYFAGAELSGAPAFVRDDPGIDFDWGTAGPGRKVGGSDFSVRWTRQMYFAAGVYRFFARVDDGVRVWVDEKLIIDQWHETATTTYVSDSYILPGAHRVRVEYFNQAGAARVRVWWERQEVYPDWKAEYFSGRLPDSKADVIRNDPQILFNWSGDAPAPGVQANNFSVRWTRRAHFDQGLYRFYIRADAGMRIWLDSSLVIDLWTNAGPGLRTVNLSLSEGEYSVRVEYYSRGDGARAELRWDQIAATPTAPPAPTSIQMASRPTAAALLVVPTAAPRRAAVPTATRKATVAPTRTPVRPTSTNSPAPAAATPDVPMGVAVAAPTAGQTVPDQAAALQSAPPVTFTVEIPSPESSVPAPNMPETPTQAATKPEALAVLPAATSAPAQLVMRAQSLTVAQSTPTAAPPAAPQAKPSLAVEPARVAPGSEMTIKGQAWRAGDEVIIALLKPGEDLQAAPPFSRAMVDGQGGFALRATLPDDPRWAGQSELIVLAHSIDWSTRLVTPLHVIAPPAPAASPAP